MTNEEIKKHYSVETMQYVADVFSAMTNNDYALEGTPSSKKLILIFDGCIRLKISDGLLKAMAREFFMFYPRKYSNLDFAPQEFFDYRRNF